jgi:hypothetical protein
MRQTNGLLCKLPECGKALVGRQTKYCSLRHGKRAVNKASYQRIQARRPSNGFLCKLPGCGAILVGRQRDYCSQKHSILSHSKNLSSFNQSRQGRRLQREKGRRAIALHSSISFANRSRVGGLCLSPQENRHIDLLENAQTIIVKRNKLGGITKRLRNGGILRCPRCQSRQTRRAGSYGGENASKRAECLACKRFWIIGKDYTPLICGKCGSDDTRKAGSQDGKNAYGYCKTGKHSWILDKDYGLPFTPAMVALLQTARATTLTSEEEARAEEISSAISLQEATRVHAGDENL